jgi:hypothetical protein
MGSRRQFLSTLGKALGAGGLLLPWAGNGALARPADLGAAAQLPVAPAVPAISSDLAQLREVRRALHACYLRQGEQLEWRPLMVNHHRPLEKSIVGRRKPTWQDCTEIAEVAMWEMVRLGPADRSNPRNALVHAVLSASGVSEVFVPAIGETPVVLVDDGN